jgi:multidrug efflux pump subunit AcrA (membrane-fusion protein)
VETGSQLAVYWYEVDSARTALAATWRPGLFVKAWLPIPEARPRAAVAVPPGALLYHQGRALVYVRLSPGRYQRREVQVLGREGERWVLADGGQDAVRAGERVVSQGAVLLLSEEFRGDQDND